MHTRFVLALLGVALVLALLLGSGPVMPLLAGATVFELQSKAHALLLGRALLLWTSWAYLQPIPLGVLGVLSFRDRTTFRERLLWVVLPALALGLLLTWLVLFVRAHFALPNPLAVLLGWLGVATGVWGALSFRRGPRARALIFPKLVGAALLCAAACAGLVMLAVESSPALQPRRELTSAGRRELVSLFRGKDPRKLAPGEVRTLVLSERQLDDLVAWGARVAVNGRTRVSLRDGGVDARASVPIPGTSRWLNISLSADLHLAEGVPDVGSPSLRVGRVSVPSFVLSLAVDSAVARLQGGRDSPVLLAAIRSLALSPESASLSYRKVEVPAGLAACLMWGDQQRDSVHAAVRTHVEHLLAVLPNGPSGDSRIGVALTSAFALARERSTASSAVAENRAALLAFGVVLGHPSLMRVLGERLDEQRLTAIEQTRSGTTLRGRNDWTRHFALSAALTVISSVAPSNAVGLLKEELDAEGGSGFSFGDLLADRAGTKLAQVATQDEEHAVRMQERLAAGYLVDDFFPTADGLPEGIPDAELQTRFGGVGGELFRKLSEEIEARVARSAAYQG